MKKEFIFPKKALEMIDALPDCDKTAVLNHIVRYGLDADDRTEEYAKIEKIIDIANSSERKDGPTSEDYSEIVGYLNLKCGTKYSSGSRKTKEMIATRFREGFTRADFYDVIYYKSIEWLDNSKMRGYLRPETLFSTKFEGYLNQARMAMNKENAKNTESSFDTDEFFKAALDRSYGGTI